MCAAMTSKNKHLNLPWTFLLLLLLLFIFNIFGKQECGS